MESIACFEKAVSLDPALVNAIEALGLSYMDSTSNQAKSCLKSIQIEPETAALYILGNLLLIDRRWSDSEISKEIQFWS